MNNEFHIVRIDGARRHKGKCVYFWTGRGWSRDVDEAAVYNYLDGSKNLRRLTDGFATMAMQPVEQSRG